MERPMLFSTEMVSAILNGQKTQTRRLVKSPYKSGPWAFRINRLKATGEITGVEEIDEEMCGTGRFVRPPCMPGDYLYIRETWAPWSRTEGIMPTIHYKADHETLPGVKWRPSIHMPKEVARLWLKVTDVRIERIKDISKEDCFKEGVTKIHMRDPQLAFHKMFLRAISREDAIRYWQNNLYVWVIEFERVERPESKEEAK